VVQERKDKVLLFVLSLRGVDDAVPGRQGDGERVGVPREGWIMWFGIPTPDQSLIPQVSRSSDSALRLSE
jgi:hypothetical protein